MSQKNRASLNRARSTRALPWRMIAAPSSSACVFSTARKCGASLPVGVLHREILLVVAHHRHQNLFRQLKILGLKVAEDHGGPLGEVRHRLHQRLILAPARAGNCARRRVQRLANDLPALGDIDHNERRAQRLLVARRRLRSRRAPRHAARDARGSHCPLRFRQSPAERLPHPAAPPPSAPAAQSAPACPRASTCSWPSKAPALPSAARQPESPRACGPMRFTVAPTYSPLGVSIFLAPQRPRRPFSQRPRPPASARRL